MEVKSPQDFFENILPKRFRKEKAVGVDVVVQVTIIGANGSDWIATVKDENIDVIKGIHSSPSLSLKMTEKDFLDLVNHKISAQKAFFSGKIQFKGNVTLALKLWDAGFL